MGKYFMEQSANGRTLYYQLYYGEIIQNELIEMKDRGVLNELADMKTMWQDGVEVVRYALQNKQSLDTFLNRGISEEKLLDVIEKELAFAANIENVGIDKNHVIFDKSFVFAEEGLNSLTFILHVSNLALEKQEIFTLIWQTIQVAQVNSNQYNIKDYLEQYLNSQENPRVSDFKEYIGNIKEQLFGEHYYSGKQSLSCRLGDQSIQVEELLEIAAPKFATIKMMAPEGEQKKAFLKRPSTNEQIDITKAAFTLGTDKKRVDYVVEGNDAISRVHAMLIYRDGSYYIKDLDSTNHTFVNRILLRPSTEIQLTPGSTIMLANEVFLFQFPNSPSPDGMLF